MNERDALLRAVLTCPEEDTPRLVFADWLEENDEPERAEFVRVQCGLANIPDPPAEPGQGEPPDEILTALESRQAWRRQWSPRYYELRHREKELFETHGREWVPVPGGHSLMIALLDTSGRVCANVAYARNNVKVTGDMRFYFNRGFCSEWWAPLEDVVGGEQECGWCAEQGPDWETGVIECRQCDSTGMVGTAGHVEAVFRAHPVERVTVTDQSPDIVYIHDGSDRWVWRRWPEVDTREILSGYLPQFLFEEGETAELVPGRAFQSRDDAERVLSRRLVRLGRELAGLPPLPDAMTPGRPAPTNSPP